MNEFCKSTESGYFMTKKLILGALVLLVVGALGGTAYVYSLRRGLPEILKVEDYKPRLVSTVYARDGRKIGEFFNEENRILTPFDKIPKRLVNAFLAIEDDKFFEHEGINYQAIVRAMIANLRAGRTVQGGSTITQQVAKSFFLSSEKTFSRKIKEAMLATKLEQNLTKEEILYLYLNNIFFGAEAYGVAAAAETYFRKPLDKLTIAECAMLGGLPQAPSRYSPIRNPQLAKDRQKDVLKRMRDVGFITAEEAEQAVNEPITVYIEKEYKEVAPDFVETVRQLLTAELGNDMVLHDGIQIHTSLDYDAQANAQKQVREGLKALDKRQGYRGAARNLQDADEIEKFLLSTRKKLEREKAPIRVITRDGNVVPDRPLALYQKKDATGRVVANLPDYLPLGKEVEGIVTSIDDRWGLAFVRVAETQALIDLSDMEWARKPDPNVSSDNVQPLKKPSAALKVGDVILVKIAADPFSSERLQKLVAEANKRAKTDPNALKGLPKLNEYARVALEQEPLVEGALLSIDQKTQDVVAMIGGYDFSRSKFNRTIQALRQTGSAFKSIIYLSALDKGWHPGKIVADAPIVFEDINSEAADGQEDIKKWKPHNYGNKFEGDMLFRQALVQSLNIPTVKILQDIGIPWAVDYARRLGIFSPLNQDLSLSLGSSGATLYEMTRAFSIINNLGKRVRPVIIHKVVDGRGHVVREKITLDRRFQKEIDAVEQYFEEKRKEAGTTEGSVAAATPATEGADAAQGETPSPDATPRFFFPDPDQLIRPTTAYLTTNILAASITDARGTAQRARALGRPAAGKTGTTNGYFDTWFIGYTPQYTTGVWVGFDQERSLGVGEAGGRTALPIWLEYMKNLHENIPPIGFAVPDGIVFANIDKKTGKLASAKSKEVVYQAFLRGTEPGEMSDSPTTKDEADFYKEDLAD